jgi:lipopolysaccharide/colanic/teichoic acid biosynthesis glycosyltransferase
MPRQDKLPDLPTFVLSATVCLALRRILDVVASSTALMCLSPLLAAIAILVKLDSRGPVIFRQVRVGMGFRIFEIYKFRTMVADAPARGPAITIGADSRITRVGRVLRNWKLDELPQLINVLIGDMSLVGPRPEVPKYVELFREAYQHILSVRPGLTDPASIKYIAESEILARASDPEREYITAILPRKIHLAREYLRERSLTGDIRLLFKTVRRLF